MSTKILIYQGDLISETADVVVNPANAFLRHGAGCAGALSAAAGAGFQKESNESLLHEGPVLLGGYRFLGAHGLRCKEVCHVVGPRVVNRPVRLEDQRALVNCVRAAIRATDLRGHKTVAIPAVSSGLFGFPKNLCASLLVQTAVTMLPTLDSLEEIRFVNNDEHTTNLFLRVYEDLGLMQAVRDE